MDGLELSSCIVDADRRRRLQWQADVSGPGTSSVSPVALNGCAPDLLDRLKADRRSRSWRPGASKPREL